MAVLIVAAHPDDEVLGCGGTMARHVAEGEAVTVAILAQGITSRGTRAAKPAIARLRTAAKAANKALGVSDIRFFDFPDNRMDTVARLDVVKTIEELAAEIMPHTLYTHFPGDLNVDHQVVAHAVATACRPQPGHPVRSILYFEVPSATEWKTPGAGPAFDANAFIDISGTLPAKMRAMAAYRSEMRAFPHPRSREAVKHLARWRGACVGVAAAEAFVVARIAR